MKKDIDAAISAVTVYSDRALVTRKNTISLTGLDFLNCLSKVHISRFKLYSSKTN